MRIFAGKGSEFIFDRGTITRAYTFDLSAEKWRLLKTGTENLMHILICMYNIAGFLLLASLNTCLKWKVRELGRIRIKILFL